jgi:hypothetical protein
MVIIDVAGPSVLLALFKAKKRPSELEWCKSSVLAVVRRGKGMRFHFYLFSCQHAATENRSDRI